MTTTLRKSKGPVHSAISAGGGVAFFLLLVLLGSGCQGSRKADDPGEASGATKGPRPPEVHPIAPPPAAAETCFNGLDDNRNHLIDEGCGVDQGEVQFVAAWPEAEADIDLYVSDPEGQVPPPDGATELGLSKSVDCPDDKSVCSGQNYENVYHEGDEVPGGTYVVRLRAERIPLGVESLVVHVGVRLPSGTSAYEVRFFEQAQEVHLEYSVPKAAPSKETKSAR